MELFIERARKFVPYDFSDDHRAADAYSSGGFPLDD